MLMAGYCVHDESVRRVADIVEREASHDRQSLPSLRFQYPDVIRFHHPERFHREMKVPGVRCEIDLIIRLQVFQRPEERIAMSGDADISGFTRQRRARDVTYCPGKRDVVYSFLDNRGKV